MTPSPADLLDRLQLIRTETIGPVTYYGLVARFGSAREALARLPSLARAAGRKAAIALADREACERELERAEEIGARFLADDSGDYPAMLAPLADRPPLLCVKGDIALFAKPAVAIVGARNASGVGRKMARMLAEGLGAAGYVVVSGLARGIDGAAHEASLRTGTIAVVAGGLDVIYPSEHETLTAEIGERGLIASERPLGQQPTARDFPRRNRLISGLSLGVVVVEAAARSGTLITARFALEQGREVFAVPGSPLDPRCQGANRLIRDGAALVESAADIIEALTSGPRRLAAAPPESETSFREDDPARLAATRALVLEALSFSPLHRDEILREVSAPAGAVIDALVDLVLAGEAEEHSGGRFSLRARD